MTIKKLVFLGAGHAHIDALAAFKAMPRADTDVHLVTPHDLMLPRSMLPSVVAGHYGLEQCSLHLPDWLAASSIKTRYSSCTGIDTSARQLQLADGSTLHYDVLSIATGLPVDRASVDTLMPGAKEHAVFVYPEALFARLWPQLLSHAEHQALHISIVSGADALGVELALALQHRLPHCRVTLIAGSQPVAARHARSVQQRLLSTLRRRNITVLHSDCVAIEADRLHLHSGASVSCDVPVLALRGQPPPWLASSGLALTEDQQIAVNSAGQSTSDLHVFAAGSVSSGSRVAQHLNLRAALDAQPVKIAARRPQGLNLLSCGDRTAIASWGTMSFQGSLAWRVRDVINQRWIRQYLT